MALIKNDIIHELNKKKLLEKDSSKECIERLLRIVKDHLATGDDLLISGFGEFRVKHKAERMGRNPKTGKSHVIPERTVVTFHPSRVLRDELNED